MIMICHAYEAQQGNVVYLQGVRQLSMEHLIIVIVPVNTLPLVSLTRDKIICDWILNAKFSDHGVNVWAIDYLSRIKI